MLAESSSIAVGKRQYIQLIGRDNSVDISKLETFVLDSDTRSVLDQAFWLLSDPRLLVNLLNLQNELMDDHQPDITKMVLFSTSNFVSYVHQIAPLHVGLSCSPP